MWSLCGARLHAPTGCAALVVMPVVRLVPGRESWRLLPRYAIGFLNMPCRSTSVIRSLSASMVKPQT